MSSLATRLAETAPSWGRTVASAAELFRPSGILPSQNTESGAIHSDTLTQRRKIEGQAK
jgi:hypothetical protein